MALAHRMMKITDRNSSIERIGAARGVGASRPLAPTWIAVPPRLRVTGRTIRAYLQPLGPRAAARFATGNARCGRWPRSQTSWPASSTQSCLVREAESGRSQSTYPRRGTRTTPARERRTIRGESRIRIPGILRQGTRHRGDRPKRTGINPLRCRRTELRSRMACGPVPSHRPASFASGLGRFEDDGPAGDHGRRAGRSIRRVSPPPRASREDSSHEAGGRATSARPSRVGRPV
jgi:hypothetical protein